MTKGQEEIIAVNLDMDLALTNTDRTIVLTDYFNEDGERCDPEDAVAAVGFDEGRSEEEGQWWAINLVGFTAEWKQ